MRVLISFTLIFQLSLVGISFADETSSCEDGQCIIRVVDELELLQQQAHENKCLPAQGEDAQDFLKKNGLTQKCFEIIQKIFTEQEKLINLSYQFPDELNLINSCQVNNTNPLLGNEVQELSDQLSCTPEKKAKVTKQCHQDLLCVLYTNTAGFLGPLGERMMPSSLSESGCQSSYDNCFTQVATSFVKTIDSFLKNSWEMIKAGSRGVANWWKELGAIEDYSSDAHLSLAQASEDEGFFEKLRNNFWPTMGTVFTGLVDSIQHYLKTKAFCQKWEGVPHHSQCLQPSEGFECVGCKAWVTGSCSVVGLVLADIVPAFLTGGMFTIAKYGAVGVQRFAQTIKLSSYALDKLQDSKLAQLASNRSQAMLVAVTSNKAMQFAGQSLSLSQDVLKTIVSKISKYFISPSFRASREVITAIPLLAKSLKTYLALTKAGPMLSFGGKVLGVSGRVILFPIQNSLMVRSFDMGKRATEAIFDVSGATVSGGIRLFLPEQAVIAMEAIDRRFLAMEKARKVSRSSARNLTHVEKLYLAEIQSRREGLLIDLFEGQPNFSFDDLIEDLFPELKYDKLSKYLSSDEILAAEEELFFSLQKIENEQTRQGLLRQWEELLTNPRRSNALGSERKFNQVQIAQHSQLIDQERIKTSFELLEIDPTKLTKAKKTRLVNGILSAHNQPGRVGQMTFAQIRLRMKILTEAGFTQNQADLIVRSGLAGRPPTRSLENFPTSYFSQHAGEILEADYLEDRKRLLNLAQEVISEDISGVLGVKKPANRSALAHFEDTLDSLYFIDYPHASRPIMKMFENDTSFRRLDLSETYGTKDFKNFKEAHHFTMTENPEISMQTMRDIHGIMMKGGVEDVPASLLGKTREDVWVGNVPRSEPISVETVKVINDNPYLMFVKKGEVGGKYYGEIPYPRVENLKPEALNRIKGSHPEVYQAVKDYQEIPNELVKLEERFARLKNPETKTYKDLNSRIEELRLRYDELDDALEDLNIDLVDALTEERISWFNQSSQKIGELTSSQKVDAYVDLVAEFQRDLISIHPLNNGNGRTTRQFALYLPLIKRGIPPPRLLNPNADIYNTLEEYQIMVKKGVQATHYLLEDFEQRLRVGLPLRYSLEFITPYARPQVSMNMKKQGSTRIALTEDGEYIDDRLYQVVLKRRIESDPSFLNRIGNNAREAFDELNQEVIAIHERNNIYYHHKKRGIERVEIGVIGRDYRHMFANKSYQKPEAYRFKIDTWYNRDQVVWRGLSRLEDEIQEDEILTMFKEIHPHMVSNSLLRRGTSNPERLREAALEDFDNYTHDIFNEGLVALAKDHSEAGPLYQTSYGYSTSKDRTVGKAFAMGAMVIADYGKQQEFQHLLSSRVLVGAYKGHKDVDLTTLKQVREDFSYKYGRQQEVMGVGAADPDSIQVVQLLDENGDAYVSYLRNPENPAEVLVLNGEFSPGDAYKTRDIIKVLEL